ncbi:hypothetical protein BDP55DRAFT_522350, partial [Colletotrichum godetiae]
QKKGPYRVKNHAAAKRCREKAKRYEINLAAREMQAMQDRMYVQAHVIALKTEVLSLRDQILEHSNCRCDMIQRYIARTANTI